MAKEHEQSVDLEFVGTDELVRELSSRSDAFVFASMPKNQDPAPLILRMGGNALANLGICDVLKSFVSLNIR